MAPLFSGLVVVSGEHDSGKTSFCMECGSPPEKIAFIDADIKGKDVNDQITALTHSFGFYRNVTHDTVGMTETAYHNYCLDLIDKIPEGIESIIWDTWTQFETTFHPYVSRYQAKFREVWSPKGDIHGAQVWQSSFDYESQIIDRLLHKCKMLLLTTYLKDESINGHKTGKQIPDQKKPLTQKAQLRVFLRHSAEYQAPIGLIAKRIAKIAVTEYGIETVAVLPRKISPCTWKHIREYWDNPVGDRKLTPDELPDESDLAFLDNKLTKNQMEILRLTPIYEDEEAAITAEPTAPENDQTKIDAVKSLKEAGKTLKQISDETGIKVPSVMRMLKQ